MRALLFSLVFFNIALSWGEDFPLKVEDIIVRDPFIYVDKKAERYYLYAQNSNRSSSDEEPRGVEVYTSPDLLRWSHPRPVLDLPLNHWARKWVWAPEVFQYEGNFYLFVTLTGDSLLENFKKPGWKNPINRLLWPEGNIRGTEIFYSESPLGPFKSFSNHPHTPKDWLALDGTLYVEDDVPYMVFCHEWVQIGDGSIDVVQLAPDLSGPVGEPVKLFNASEAVWSQTDLPSFILNGQVTDGVFFHRTQTDKLVMIWSSFGDNGYAVGQAMSESGRIMGPWKHIDTPLFSANGGHGMLFRDLGGQLFLALHQPNHPQDTERLQLFPVDDSGDLLRLHEEKFDTP